MIRSKINKDRKLFLEYRSWLGPVDPATWQVVGEMLKARSRYYRGEIIRAKHDTQRFAMGEDPKEPSRFGEMQCDWVDTYLTELDIDADEHLDFALNQMKTLTRTFEKITYGGQT